MPMLPAMQTCKRVQPVTMCNCATSIGEVPLSIARCTVTWGSMR